MAQDERAWSRMHTNGMVALVFQWAGDKFSAGAVPANGARGIRGNVRGPVDRAQQIADADAGCPEPCSCPPWSE